MDDVGSALGGMLIIAIVLAAAAFWIWALVDAVRAPEGSYRTGTKLIWVLVIAITQFVGAVVYYLVGRGRDRPLAA